MPPTLQYPDLVAPPAWTYFRVGGQIRLIPPGTRADTAAVTIVVSPLVPRQPQMPGPALLVQMALDAEAKASFEILTQVGPTPIATATGLEGVSFDVTGYARPSRPVEHRLYAMLADAAAYYGLSYLASPAAYDEHVETFWRTVQSVQPVAGGGGAVPPPTAPPTPFVGD